MLKQILPLLVAGWLGLGALPALAQPRIATVDFQKVFEKYWRREQAAAALKDREATFEKEIKGMRDDMEKMATDYEKLREAANDQIVTKEERDKRKTVAENKLLELKTADNTLRTADANARDQLASQQKRLYESIVGEIAEAVKAKAKAGGYTLVLNTSSPSAGIALTVPVIYTNGENDLTDTVLAQINAAAPPAAPTSENPKAVDKTNDKK